MSVSTINTYGKIAVNDQAIAMVARHCALEIYGVVDLVSASFMSNVKELFKKDSKKTRGIKVLTVGDRIHIDVDVILKYGVSIDAVAESVRRSIKYNVEKFTGMIVDAININVEGVKV